MLAEYMVIITVWDHFSATVLYFQLAFGWFCFYLYNLEIQTEVERKTLTLSWTDWFLYKCCLMMKIMMWLNKNLRKSRLNLLRVSLEWLIFWSRVVDLVLGIPQKQRGWILFYHHDGLVQQLGWPLILPLCLC